MGFGRDMAICLPNIHGKACGWVVMVDLCAVMCNMLVLSTDVKLLQWRMPLQVPVVNTYPSAHA